MTDYFDSGSFAEEYQSVLSTLCPYVAQGLTFYTEAKFERGAENLRKFCILRSESIRGQIDGTIPATKAGQMEHSEALVSVGDLNLGQTIEFSGLVMGVTSEDIITILDAVCGDREHSIETLVATVQELMEDSSQLVPIVLRVWNASGFVRNLVLDFVSPILLLILSIIVIWIAVAVVKKPRRQ